MIRPRKKPRPGRLKGEDLYDLRVACWLRDRELCTRCGVHTLFHAPEWWTNSYHMAHIKAKRIGGDNIRNVKTECGDCHRKYHNYGPSMEKPCPRK